MGEGGWWRAASEEELLEAWLGGDQTACAELFERYYQRIERFFHNKVSEAAQDDLINETFLACLTSVSRFRGQAQFRTFLFAIARNVLAEYIRRQKRHTDRLGSDTDVDEIPNDQAPPDATAAQHQQQRVLLEALHRIPRLHRAALELYYWSDLTAAEIADLLRIPTATVKTRLRDGRAYLRQQFDDLSTSSAAPRSTSDDVKVKRWVQRVRAKPPPGPRAAELSGPDPAPAPAPAPQPATTPEPAPAPAPAPGPAPAPAPAPEPAPQPAPRPAPTPQPAPMPAPAPEPATNSGRGSPSGPGPDPDET